MNITILPAADTDGDGMSSGAGDCDDADPTVTEALAYVPDLDLDGHGDDSAAPLLLCGAAPGYVLAPGDDCNDNDARAYPGAPELCGYGDEDCAGGGDPDAGAVDMPTWYLDNDHDLHGGNDVFVGCDAPSAFYTQVTGDCDDTEATIYPGAPESCDVVADTNCDGSSGADDLDADGFTACEECDDRTALINPSATETCATMGIDDNCDGSMDAGARDTTTFWADQDEDGFGDPAASIEACETPSGYVSTYYDVDCDDTNNAAFPGSSEFCDGSGADNNCDGVGDDGAVDIRTFAPDADGDLFPAEDLDVESCDLTMAGHLELSRGAAVIRDCDDAHAEAYPGGFEVCDGLDNDCANSVDDLEMDAHEIAGDDSEGLAHDYGNMSGWTSESVGTSTWLVAESSDLTLDSGDADWFKWEATDNLTGGGERATTLQIDVTGVAGDFLVSLWEGPDENTATARLVQEYTGLADSTGIVPDLSFTEGGQSGDDAAADGPYWFLRIESIPAGWQCTDPFSTYSVQISYY